jgi:hypothetical protein
MNKRVSTTLAVIGLAIMMIIPGRVLASTYGSDNYGACNYDTGCPASSGSSGTTTTPKASGSKPSGSTTTSTPAASNTITLDADEDGKLEEAKNTDNDLTNGYEEFNDPDGSSVLLATVYENGVASFILDTNHDGQPDVYWNPVTGHLSPVTVEYDSKGTAWVYKDSDGNTQRYYIKLNQSSQSSSPTSTSGRNRRITSNTFGGGLYEAFGKFGKNLPAVVAYGLPFILLLILGVMILWLYLQSKREQDKLDAITDDLNRKKQAALEKQTTWSGIARSLRSPAAALRSSIEALRSQGLLNDQSAKGLNGIMTSLTSQIDSLLSRLEGGQVSPVVTQPLGEGGTFMHYLLSPFVLVTLISLFLFNVLTQFILMDFWVVKPGVIDFLVQIGLGILLAQLFVSSVRNLDVKRQNRKYQQRLLDEQIALDASRDDLFSDASGRISGDVSRLGAELGSLSSNGTDVTRLREDYDRLKAVVDSSGSSQPASIAATPIRPQTVSG